MCEDDHSLASSPTNFGWNGAICDISHRSTSSRTVRYGCACGDAILAYRMRLSEHVPMGWLRNRYVHGGFVMFKFLVIQKLLNSPN